METQNKTVDTKTVEVITAATPAQKTLSGVALVNLSVTDSELTVFVPPTPEDAKRRVAACRSAVRSLFVAALNEASLLFEGSVDGRYYLDLGAQLRVFKGLLPDLVNVSFFQLLAQSMKECASHNRGDVFVISVEASETASRIAIEVQLSPRFRALGEAGKVKAAEVLAAHAARMKAVKQNSAVTEYAPRAVEGGAMVNKGGKNGIQSE